MKRWATILLLGAFCLSLAGCADPSDKGPNPDKLPYSTEGPPKRDKIPSGGGGGAPKKPK
jgi:hypothetical protein